jgi:DNA-binding MarR family transcriptional regulator
MLPPVGLARFLHQFQRLRMLLAAEIQPALRARGLAPSTLFMLDMVERHPYPSEICRELGMPPPTASRLLKTLEAEGYVLRESVAEDLRRQRFRLTAAGLALREHVQRIVEASVERRLGRLSGPEREELERLMQRLVDEEDGAHGG